MDKGTIAHIGDTKDIITKYQEDLLSGSEWKRLGTHQVTFEDYSSRKIEVALGEDFIIDLKLRQNKPVKDISVSIDIRNDSNEFVAHINNADDRYNCKFNTGNEIGLSVTLKNINLAPGNYMISIWAGTDFGENFDYIENCMPMRVVQNQNIIKRTTPYDKRAKVVLASNWENR
jgi:hypothetical protein